MQAKKSVQRIPVEARKHTSDTAKPEPLLRTPHGLINLQRTVGNSATTRLVNESARRSNTLNANQYGSPSLQREESSSPLSPAEKQELEDKLDAVAAGFKWLCLKQRDAVDDLLRDAEKVDPPPLWQTLLISASELALTFALGGVGGAVATAALKKLEATGIPDATARFVADAVKDATKKAASMGITGITTSLRQTTTDPRVLFFRGQRDTLTDVAQEAESKFLQDERSRIRSAKEPLKQAEFLLGAQKANSATAREMQRNETLDQWANYLASNALGQTGEGQNKDVDLGDQLGDTSGAGVLGVVINVTGPGAPPTIERAEIEGLNEGLRGVIANRPIGSLRMPITVKGEVGAELSWGDRWLAKKNRATIKVGRNASQTVWVSPSSGFRWLYLRSNPQPSLGRIPNQELWEGAFKGARLLLQEDLGGMTVGDKLSG